MKSKQLMGLGMLKIKSFFIVSAVLCCFASYFTTTARAECPLADLSGDCLVDMADLIVLADDWLSLDLPTHANLVNRWRLDESAGETATDDISGNTGQLYGDPQWMPYEGSLQGGLYFDGVDDYIKITGYKGVTGTTSRTCAAWIKTQQATIQILSWGGTTPGEKWVIRINEDGTLRAEVSGGYIYGTTSIIDGEWHHIAVLLESDATPDISDVKLYIDGNPETLGWVVPYAINTAVADDVKVGVYSEGLKYFNGMIDDVRIYDGALSSKDIIRLYQFGSALRHNPDLTSDNKVNVADLASVSSQWNRQEPAIIISEFLTSNDSDDPPITEQGQLRDGDGDSSDWIELYNQTDFPIDLHDWAMTDDAGDMFQWEFPENTILDGQSFMIVFASGKKQSDYPDNYPYVDSQGYLHTNFKLSASGEYLALARPDGAVEHVYNAVEDPDSGEFGYPEQEENISYGILNENKYYFALPTPGDENREYFLGFVDAPDYSHERGFYDSTFSLTLTSETEDAVIRYTTNGTDPTISNGATYTDPILLTVSPTTTSYKCIRAMAYRPGYETSKIKSKTYLLNATDAMKGLPAVCLSGSPSQTFFNPSGVMAIVGGAWGGNGWYKVLPGDYNNVLGHGMDYERPVSMEYINPDQAVDFQEDCGLRVHGSAWMRPRYQPATSGIWYGDGKYSLRLCFRTTYGDSYFRHSVFEEFPDVGKIDSMVLRAGHNDRTNPFVRDEMIRRLQHYTGNPASLGTFVNLFINGSYKGYYNLCERINEEYCQKNFDSKAEWDVVGWVQPDNVLEARDGDMVAFTEYINYARNNDLENPVHYNNVISQLDLEQFIDYLIVQCWGGNWDWPQNNWTATAERSPNRKWRFFVWDAEGAMDNSLDRNRLGNLYSDSSYLSRLYQALYVNEDFRMLFADRLQKHFFESDGVMTEEFLDTLFWQLAEEVQGVIPSISTYIPVTYIPNRNAIFLDQCESWGLFTFEGPRFYLDGREIEKFDEGLQGSQLSLQNSAGHGGDVYFTLDGTDPRGSVSQETTSVTLVTEDAPKRVLIPTSDIGTNWQWKINYNDSAWDAGLPADNSNTGGVGYEDGTGNEPYITYDVFDQMYDQQTSAYIRVPFTVDSQELSEWNYLTLSIRYDDAFVAYINGTEVCRRGFSGTPAWNSWASSQHENNNLEAISLNAYLSVLQPGDNILAIHGLNIGTTSSDFIISPILEAGVNASSGWFSPSAQEYSSPITLQKSASVKARTLSGGTWSALREVDIVIGHVNENLRISELMYHPNGDPNEEFIELTNIGDDPINLYKVSFSEGVDYSFGDRLLQPDEFLLLVRNQSVFQDKYGMGLPVAGQFEGALNDAGDKLKLRDVAGNKIQTLDFEDGWYDITDGDGFSLNVVDPAHERTALPTANLVAHWAFDESDGTTVLNATGTNHGTTVNMTNTDRVLGFWGNAMNFDGYNDYVEIPGYKGITGTTSRTCSAWIKTSMSSFQVINWGSSDSGSKWAIRLNDDGTVRAEVNSGYIYGLTDITDGYWHHIAVVLEDDGSPDVSEIRIYVDGKLEPVGAVQAYPIDTVSSENVKIGINFTETVFSDGFIDDVRIYDSALLPQEIDTLARDTSWSKKELWRPSAIRGGTPGRDETPAEQLPLPGAVVINEILSHSHAELPDWIELYNTTDDDIAIGGWFISDAFGLTDVDRKKYQIPAGIVLTPASPYYVIEEGSFNNASDLGCRTPFALSEGGETLYLQSAQGEDLTGYFTKEEFGATQTNVSLGRFQKSTGTWNFVPLSSQTQGTANAYPQVGPVIMTEIMYNPGSLEGDQDHEYIELMNITDQTVRTAGWVSTYSSPTAHIEEWIPWQFTDGITFEFPVDMELAPGERILLVKDLEAFNAEYSSVPGGTVVIEWTGGNLDNGGEKLQLSVPGDQEYQQDRYYIRQDRVNYDDEDGWPQLADGTGNSLTHIQPDTQNANYTNDPANWTEAAPTPGW